MGIASFDDLLDTARQQPEPQRLLFVFTRAERPDDPNPEQLAAYKAGSGGALTPLACLDKSLDELGSFPELAGEARQYVPDWSVVFVAALGGRAGRLPTSAEAEAPLNQMVGMIKTGAVGTLIPFDTQGNALLLNT